VSGLRLHSYPNSATTDAFPSPYQIITVERGAVIYRSVPVPMGKVVCNFYILLFQNLKPTNPMTASTFTPSPVISYIVRTADFLILPIPAVPGSCNRPVPPTPPATRISDTHDNNTCQLRPVGDQQQSQRANHPTSVLPPSSRIYESTSPQLNDPLIRQLFPSLALLQASLLFHNAAIPPRPIYAAIPDPSLRPHPYHCRHRFRRPLLLLLLILTSILIPRLRLRTGAPAPP